ncbi:MAG: hypothetical protein GX996_03570 [Firmicutes bacterium]|nr:hypothetical protein [Bacillota bacterium]
MKYNLELLKSKIAAIVPAAHTEGGEATLLINIDGKKYLDRRSTRWIIKKLALLFNIDLQAVRKNYGPQLGRKRYIPVPLGIELIYLPLTLKTDTFPVNRKMGYISLVQIEGTKEEKQNNIILLRSGQKLLCFNTSKTIQLRLKEGRLLQKILISELLPENPFYYVQQKTTCAAKAICREKRPHYTNTVSDSFAAAQDDNFNDK